MPSIGSNIRERREKFGLSQSALAEAINESRQTIYKYESGLVSNIPIVKLEAIAEVLQCSPTDLAGWETKSASFVMEDSLPYITSEEQSLLECWHKATDKERRSIAFILSEYGMPEPKSAQRTINHSVENTQ